jgi:hypothetical protein
VMRFRTNAANAIRNERHFFNGTADNESLKTAQFRDLEVRVCHIAFIVKKDLDLAMTFQACDGVNADSLCHVYLL